MDTKEFIELFYIKRNGCPFNVIVDGDNMLITPGCNLLINLVTGVKRHLTDIIIQNDKKVILKQDMFVDHIKKVELELLKKVMQLDCKQCKGVLLYKQSGRIVVND